MQMTTCYKSVPEKPKRQMKKCDKDHSSELFKRMKQMYTIVMDEDKHLVPRIITKLYQREKLVDKIQFLLPETYGDLTIADCTVRFKYLDQANVAHTEELVLSKIMWGDYLRYVFPVDTKLTKFAGDITGRLTITYIDYANQETHVLHTDEITITISPLNDYYGFIVDDSLEVIDQKIMELTAKLEATKILADSIDLNKADNLFYDDDELHLTANGTKIGDPVRIKSYELRKDVAHNKDVKKALNDLFWKKEGNLNIATKRDVKRALDFLFKILNSEDEDEEDEDVSGSAEEEDSEIATDDEVLSAISSIFDD